VEGARYQPVVLLQAAQEGDVAAATGHYIIEDGAFAKSYEQLRATGWRLNWESAPAPGAVAKPKSKLKFTCPRCSQNIWGKPDTLVDCGHCDVRMILNEEKTDRTI
jgi:hypothetical protein